MIEKLGNSTLKIEPRPVITNWAAVGGKREKEGPLGEKFDYVNEDTTFGENTWEKAESAMQKEVVSLTLKKAKLKSDDIDFLFAGDLLNQCIASSFGLREFEIPLIGMYGACSTMAETICMASVFVASGGSKRSLAVASSHFCTAERQFRFPLEYGGQRTPTAQWTATASGCTLIESEGSGPHIAHIAIGKIMDLGVTDANNMGAAMAPAAADTIFNFLQDTGTKPEDYDMIITGDLASVGSSLLYQLLDREGVDIRAQHTDCGLLLYNINQQDVKAGGSGCGCSASVLCAHLLDEVKSGKMKNLLFVATGALLSTTSSGQGQSIPGIAHLVHITAE